jgi:hypothetical protein
VSTSGGRAVRETYCCVNGTTSASYPSEWYAFSAGQARFDVLTADWADTNLGTGTAYSDDDAAHWKSSTPQYKWLKADLVAHPGGLKFAFFHYPLYSDHGGGTLEPVAIAGCHAFDAYAIGWYPNKGGGSSCGAASPPVSADHVYHYLLVSVSGTNVTVAPTDEYGRTFDVVTYVVG